MFWSRLKTLFQGVKTPLDERRSQLRREQRETAQLLREAFLAYERRLASFEAHLRRSKSQNDAMAELTLLEEAQGSLQKLLKRLTIADQETQTVLHEWQDWQTMKDLRSLTAHERERLTLLRSELIARGHAIDATPVRPTAFVTKKPTQKTTTYQPTALAEDRFPEWDEVMRPRINNEVAFWDEACAQLPTGHSHSTAAFVFAQRKKAHGMKKQLGKM